MNENLNLVEILKGCPRGTKFYSSVFGEVVFKGIIEKSTSPICFKLDTNEEVFMYVTVSGKLYHNMGECVIFPSRTQRDWAKFEKFWDKPKVEKFDVNTLQPFDRILVRYGSNLNWQTGLFSYRYGKCIYSNGTLYYQCIPYNDETKNLLGTINRCPDYYKWWEE